MEQIRKTRGVPAKRGGRVLYSGESPPREGTIKSAITQRTVEHPLLIAVFELGCIAVFAMPVDWSKYPDDWNEIAQRIKDEAGWKCQKCGKQCRFPGEDFDTHKRTLTVAHVNHVEMDCRDENLVALCPACHLEYDGYRKAMQRLAKKRIKSVAESVLF